MYLVGLVLVCMVVLTLLLSVLLVKYYVDPAESYLLATLVIGVSVCLTSLNVLLIPIDIYGLSSPIVSSEDIKSLMNSMYLLTFFINFFLIPFTYFYGEERQEEFTLDYDYNDSSSNNQYLRRSYQALKYTFLLLITLAVFFLLALFFKSQAEHPQQQHQQWAKQLQSLSLETEQLSMFLAGLMTVFGLTCWVLYGGYGLASLPFALIRSQKSIHDTRNEVKNDLSSIRDKYRSIQEKYVRSHSKVSRADQRLLTNLKKQEHLLSIKSEKIDLLERENPLLLQNIFKVLYPFQFIIGLGFLGFSGCLLLSLITSTFDKYTHSSCGFKCGYLIDKQSYFNIIDHLLVTISQYFPLDFFLFFILMLYIFIAVFYGILKLGIKFFIFNIYSIKKHETYPQALLLAVFIMNMIFLSICTLFLTLIPQYFTFGDQWYFNNTQKVFCNLQAITSKDFCKMSNISQYAHKIQLSIPFFSQISFVTTAMFIVVNLSSMLYSFFRKQKSKLDDEYDIEVEETRKLLHSEL